jgi:predicted RND superfamily exporter protein
MITSLTLMAGAMAILQDPIFNGMAISLLFGAGIATVFTLIVIPMGCISAEKRFIKHGCVALEEKISQEDETAGNKTSA